MRRSSFSTLFLEKWTEAESKGILRTPIETICRRSLSGDYNVMVQFNPLHSQKKRDIDPELMKVNGQITEKLNGSNFNFSQVSLNEYICVLRSSFSLSGEEFLEVVELEGDHHLNDCIHAVLVNVSPLMKYHSLFVLEIGNLKPQIIESRHFTIAVKILTLIDRDDFCLGFSSIGAWSSVNHFHLHGFITGDINPSSAKHFPVAYRDRTPLLQFSWKNAQTVVGTLPDWPVQCICIESKENLSASGKDDSNSNQSIAECAAILVDYLQHKKIPHNILFLRHEGLRIYIFPRKLQAENGKFIVNSSGPFFRFAIAEVSGLVVAPTHTSFTSLNEATYLKIMREEVSLDKDVFDRLVSEVKEIVIAHPKFNMDL